jgi:enoyl-CoA hydratase/carnithine racemase
VIHLPEIGMGLIRGAGGTASLAVRIGRERTAHLALSGEQLTAGEALAWGLFDEVTAAPGARKVSVTSRSGQEAAPLRAE